ncbi:SRPBCC family protein [Amycolatopsis sp. NBC_01480]|uniref:SRPBCC family protein n=1 Tax=Amycolatopsis sp. NBC_01480 TaxID=2903562 RepID=UPI002E2CB2F6|nr:SRPBCC family protein [Amycolatopsis sp. NBC_01480]
MLRQGVTRSIGIAARPADVVAFVADPETMPRYAPEFAKSVRPSGGAWVAETSRGTLQVSPVVAAAAGTVDFHLTAGDGSVTVAHTRTFANGDGAEFVFTLLLPESAAADVLADQGRVLEVELARLKELLETS